MVRYEQVRTFFYSTESQEAKSEVLSISAICPRACHSRSSHVWIYFQNFYIHSYFPVSELISQVSEQLYKYCYGFSFHLKFEPLDKSVKFLPDAAPEVSVVADAEQLQVAPVQLHIPGPGGSSRPPHLLQVRDVEAELLRDDPAHLPLGEAIKVEKMEI